MKVDNKNIVITSGVRTAIGKFCGSLKDMTASDLGALVIKTVMKKSNEGLSALPDFHFSISQAIHLSTRNGANETLQATLLAASLACWVHEW